MKIMNFFNTLLLIILISLQYLIFCCSTRIVDGTSMYPTLHDRDIIYVSQMIPLLTPIRRGDIIGITTDISGQSNRIIKRVIGLPGEEVELKNGIITVNGKKINQPFLTPDVKTDGEFHFKLNEGQYVVLGDNRPVSMDSRDTRIGIIHKSEIDFVYIGVKHNRE